MAAARGDGQTRAGERARGWMRRIVGARHAPTSRGAAGARAGGPVGPLTKVQERIRALPERLQGLPLPHGVVELVVEDRDVPLRQLLDIHDSRVAVVSPGSAVPWASISGSPAAWAAALGPLGELGGLQLTGDELLARRLLAVACPSPE